MTAAPVTTTKPVPASTANTRRLEGLTRRIRSIADTVTGQMSAIAGQMSANSTSTRPEKTTKMLAMKMKAPTTRAMRLAARLRRPRVSRAGIAARSGCPQWAQNRGAKTSCPDHANTTKNRTKPMSRPTTRVAGPSPMTMTMRHASRAPTNASSRRAMPRAMTASRPPRWCASRKRRRPARIAPGVAVSSS